MLTSASMKFGPYRQEDMKQIEAALKTAGIAYEVTFEKQELEEKLDSWRHEPVGAVYFRTAVQDFSCLYVEIADEKISELGTGLEAYGIDQNALAPEPSFDEVEATVSPKDRSWRVWLMIWLFSGLVPGAIAIIFYWLI